MPLVVDKEKVRMDILMAFERCLETSPITNVSLRDIAKEAGMSHANLLNYFSSKDDLVVSYCRYTQDFIADGCRKWFKEHSRKRYKSNLSYLNAFMQYVARAPEWERRPIAPTQTYVLGHYNPEIREIIHGEYKAWYKVMEECLVEIYGDEVGKNEAAVMVVLVAGTFIANYNGALKDSCTKDMIGAFAKLAQS